MDFNRYRSRVAELHEFEACDKVCTAVTTKQTMADLFSQMHGIRAALNGGQMSFDTFPTGWDKTLRPLHVEDESFEEIHFLGDKVYQISDRYFVS